MSDHGNDSVASPPRAPGRAELRALARRLRAGWEAGGGDAAALERLFAQLEQQLEVVDSMSEAQIAGVLRQAGGVPGDASGDEVDLDAVAAELAACLAPLARDPGAAAEGDRRREEVRGAARGAIARSLRRAGIEPKG